MGSLTSNALSCVPNCVVILVSVGEVGVAGGLSLAEILDGTEVITCNGLDVLNNLLNNDSLGVSVLNSLVMNSLGRTI